MSTVYVEPARFHVKTRLYNTEICFGKGVAQLLQLTEEHGSLYAAYTAMGMSSSKAWKILRRAEADLGFALVESVSGGKHGGSSRVTEAGKELLRKYQAFDELVQHAAKSAYREIFDK